MVATTSCTTTNNNNNNNNNNKTDHLISARRPDQSTKKENLQTRRGRTYNEKPTTRWKGTKNYFGIKYGNRKNITESPNGLIARITRTRRN